jgi:uncharacterized protein YjiS (DUF1127 family)
MSFIALSHGTARGLAAGTPSSIETGLYHAAAAAMQLLAKAGVTIADYWRDRQKVRWLANADDAVLRDLGIARSDIPRLVRTGRR